MPGSPWMRCASTSGAACSPSLRGGRPGIGSTRRPRSNAFAARSLSLQALGFTLDEIADVLRAVDDEVASCERERPRFEVVLARVDQKIADLTAIRRSLIATLKRCRDGNCTLLEGAARAKIAPKTSRRDGDRRRMTGATT